MSYEKFIAFILEEFGEDARVRNDKETGRYTAKSGEYRVSMGHSSKRARVYNVRNKRNFVMEVA